MHPLSRKGFTLIELLVVIVIIAILAIVVVLTLNPAALLQQSRDSNRVSDMATINSAINLYNTDQSGASSYSLGSSNTVYVSIPDPTATSSSGDHASSDREAGHAGPNPVRQRLPKPRYSPTCSRSILVLAPPRGRQST
jgi:prepilin-type N-terminal cleavage/methylation domain-containing protein